MPPIHVNWDTSTNATKSALRGVTEDLGDLANLEGHAAGRRPAGFDGVPLINMYSYVYVHGLPRRGVSRTASPTAGSVLLDPKFKGRIALYDDGIGFHPVAVIMGGGTHGRHPRQHAAGLGLPRPSSRRRSRCWARTRTSPPGSRTARSTSPARSLSNARAAKQNGIAVSWTVPKEGAKVDTDGMWIPKGLPENELHWAKEYVNFAMSQSGQQVWTDGPGPAAGCARA